MKFESKFGIGEIVHHEITQRKHVTEFLKVKCVAFTDKGAEYLCRYPHGMQNWFSENELEGDPNFDQELGYPAEESELL